jgi:hypothetical protein
MVRCQDDASEEATTDYGKRPSNRPPKIVLETLVAVSGTTGTDEPGEVIQGEVEANPQRFYPLGAAQGAG